MHITIARMCAMSKLYVCEKVSMSFISVLKQTKWEHIYREQRKKLQKPLYYHTDGTVGGEIKYYWHKEG